MARKRRPALRRVAFIGNSPPRECGIATFTTDLTDAVAELIGSAGVFVVPVNDIPEGYDYPDRVWFQIVEKEIASYRRAAEFLNINNVDVVSLQHEFGIFGGPGGSHILALLRELRMPMVTTLHTILREPDSARRVVMDELAELSDKLVVMTVRGAEILREVYSVDNDKIEIIPHGIHDVPFVDPSFYKDKFGVEGKNVLLTFGLLGPGKGIEHAIAALPAIIKRHPETVYIILGATHPTLKRQQGEIYRLSLQQLARELGVERNVIFHNRFVSLGELTEFLGAADLYVTPFLNTAQVVSGTLAYAVGAGKAVVSTPYWHAEELLAGDRGILSPVGDSEALGAAVIELLDDPVRRNAMRKRAYMLGREMIWSKVARRYQETFQRARDLRLHHPRPAFEATTLDKTPGELPLLKLDHLLRMTDGTGMLQHSTFSVPNYAEGYATDDNARALILCTLLEEIAGSAAKAVAGPRARYMALIQHAFNRETGRFRNFLSHDRRWLEEVGSEDSHGRAIWALGTVVARGQRQDLRAWAGQFFEAGLPPTLQFASPRAWAFTLLGIDGYLSRFSGDRIAEDARRVLTERLLEMYRDNSEPDWPWFENTLTYCNAKLPHALLLARDVQGLSTPPEGVLATALESLRWLVDLQSADDGHFVPIGCNGFYPRGRERARFDQQPIEAHATVSACLEAHRATGDKQWKVEAHRAFDWFIGRNDLRTPVYDSSTGGCHDGLQPDHVNPNQGAESTLAFLLSLAQMRLSESTIEIPAREELVGAGA
ncbi:MAG: glycosyltransferase family 4 protein [Planctomycetes bacterium]|nr:glycosyltransferase family 4 protein [Planctomycetota bacterium]